MITLFEHQDKSVTAIEKSWAAGNRNVLLVLPTGAGKTLVKAEVARKKLYLEFAMNAMMNPEVTIIFAHRDVLLSQISDAMCMVGVRHTFIASKPTVNNICNLNVAKHGDSFYDETSKVIIASVDAYLAKLKKGQLKHLIPLVGLWQLDEAHHLLEDNKWGWCVESLVNANGLGVTATPLRADGKGLGRHAEGVFDDMIVGSSMGELISLGRLSPYKIYVPPMKVDVSGMRATSSGDYNQKELAKRTDKSEITGDAVQHYLRIANGMQAITYCVNIGHSEHVADQFNKAGIPSKALSSNTPIGERQRAIEDFKRGTIKNLTNADLFGEGFDVPALECGIMLRKTQSYSLFKQQFGRPLRAKEDKPYGVIIDHVNNVRDMMAKYNLSAPHDDPVWTLDRPNGKRSNGDGENIPVGRVCPECAAFYIPHKPSIKVCPDCHHEETPEEANAAQRELQVVDGNLVELSVDAIDALINEIHKVNKPVEQLRHEMKNAPSVARNGAANKHYLRQTAQNRLREAIQSWCEGVAFHNQWDIKTVQQEFEVEFGLHILKAQTLSERQSLELLEKVKHA